MTRHKVVWWKGPKLDLGQCVTLAIYQPSTFFSLSLGFLSQKNWIEGHFAGFWGRGRKSLMIYNPVLLLYLFQVALENSPQCIYDRFFSTSFFACKMVKRVKVLGGGKGIGSKGPSWGSSGNLSRRFLKLLCRWRRARYTNSKAAAGLENSGDYCRHFTTLLDLLFLVNGCSNISILS